MRDTTWWVHSKDDFTNEVVDRQIGAPENAHEGVMCADEVARPMWRCRSYEDVRVLESARLTTGLNFEIYRQRGNRPAEKISFRDLQRQARKKHLMKSVVSAARLS